MRIAVLVNLFPSLSETFILNQITGLLDRGHTVDIYANRVGETEQVHADVTSYRLSERTRYMREVPGSPLRRYFTALQTLGIHMFTNPRACVWALLHGHQGRSKYSLNLLYIVRPFLPQRSYDVIHCHFGPMGVRGALLKDLGLTRGKMVTTFYGHDVSRYPLTFGRDIYQQLFETGDLFLVLSERMRQQLAGLGCDESRIVVHHLGADCRRMSLIPRHAGPDRVVCIVTVARFVEKKGLEYAIRAVAELVHSGIRLEYSIIGDGPLFGQMQRLIREQRVGHCVQLLGWKNQDEVAEILGDADIFLAPSVTASDGDEEGTPTVLVEAMARGLPVVSTYHSAIPEMVIDGVSGFLVPERDVDALAERLTYLIENPQIWPEMGRKGRAFVEQHFDINKLNDQLVNLYQRMTEER